MAALDLDNINVDRTLHYFAKDTVARIRENFARLNISTPTNKKGRKDAGGLFRSMFWRVYGAAGGNMQVVSFFFLNYATFVETGTGADVRFSPLEALTKLETLSREGTSRVAKPFLMSEIRIHTRMLMERLAREYAYFGEIIIMRAFEGESTEFKNVPPLEKDWYTE